MAGKNPYSLFDLMRGLGRVHRGIAESVPGAKRVPDQMVDRMQGKTPTEVQEEYNRREMYGKTKSGEPYRGAIVPMNDERPGHLPRRFKHVIAPESEIERVKRGMLGFDPHAPAPSSTMYVKPIGAHSLALPLTENFVRNVDQMKMPGQKPAIGYDIDAMNIGRGFGPMQYRSVWDMINASGDVNQSDFLTRINEIRRLGNVAPLYLRDHHDWSRGPRGIMPINESYDRAVSSTSQQLFNDALSLEPRKNALENILGYDASLIDDAVHLQPKNLRGLDPETIAGLLYTREAQMTKAKGPESKGVAMPREPGAFANLPMLTRITEPIRSRGTDTSHEAAIGPHTLGRTLTTEEALDRMLRVGEDPDEIVEDFIRQIGPNISGLRGRYARGGLAHATRG